MRKILFCYLVISVSIFAEILPIHSLEEIDLESFSQTTLVLVDIDDVLIYPKDALLQNWRTFWRPQGSRLWTAEEDTIAWMSASFQILDPAGPTLLKLLYTRGVPTIGLTAFAMDQPGILESVPLWRSKHLEELGLSFRMEKEVVFPIPPGFIPPSFEKGVLYCGDCYRNDRENKGKILSLYLDWQDWTPDLVVHIDDGQKHLESVQRELDRRKIPFLGFHYIPKALDPIEERVAELQYKTILDQKRWLSDEEARLRL
jgi:hypothetical protein